MIFFASENDLVIKRLELIVNLRLAVPAKMLPGREVPQPRGGDDVVGLAGQLVPKSKAVRPVRLKREGLVLERRKTVRPRGGAWGWGPAVKCPGEKDAMATTSAQTTVGPP